MIVLKTQRVGLHQYNNGFCNGSQIGGVSFFSYLKVKKSFPDALRTRYCNLNPVWLKKGFLNQTQLGQYHVKGEQISRWTSLLLFFSLGLCCLLYWMDNDQWWETVLDVLGVATPILLSLLLLLCAADHNRNENKKW